MQIVNPEGQWLRNDAAFPLQDPEVGHLFVPHQVVKIKRSVWAQHQPVIVVVADPLASPLRVTPTAVKKVSPV